ncbi:hypothetical protein ACJO1H_15465 [Vibrio parahaemolyticus]|uniref:hypothetical protein n=1 Tax=Vibrio TaxID=662 RepID=UPI0029649260|nr:hypothetical protein [Vibrio sp. YT-18]MDW1552385.1 hypothetical protein [Vibrio sp. YT-18]HCG6673961.1 hypothetical protein [Vibrio parahaemolyticus]
MIKKEIEYDVCHKCKEENYLCLDIKFNFDVLYKLLPSFDIDDLDDEDMEFYHASSSYYCYGCNETYSVDI